MTKIHTNPGHLRKSGNKLTDFGSKLASGGEKLESAGQNLVSHASGDKSGFGAVISKAMGKGVQITGKVFQEGGRVVEGAGNRLGKTGDLHEGADEHGRGLMNKLHPDAKVKTGSHNGSRKPSSKAPAAGGKDRAAGHLPVGKGGDTTHLSGNLADPKSSHPIQHYDAAGKAIPTDNLKHPHQDLIDGNLIDKASKIPTRTNDALKPGVDRNHPAVAGNVPKSYDPNAGLGEKGWEKEYWPKGTTDSRGNRELEWPDSQKHPQGFGSPESRQPSVLQPGQTVDRFGSGFGRFASPPDTPYPARGLPPENLTAGYHQYEVVKPIPVWEGPIAEAMGQPGGGKQYYMPHAVVDLVNAGYLKEVKL